MRSGTGEGVSQLSDVRRIYGGIIAPSVTSFIEGHINNTMVKLRNEDRRNRNRG